MLLSLKMGSRGAILLEYLVALKRERFYCNCGIQAVERTVVKKTAITSRDASVCSASRRLVGSSKCTQCVTADVRLRLHSNTMERSITVAVPIVIFVTLSSGRSHELTSCKCMCCGAVHGRLCKIA